MALRRPVVPSRPYAPPVEAATPAPVEVVDQIGKDLEARTVIYPGRDQSEISVRLSKEWKACDVYLDVPAAVNIAASAAVCTVRVFAISGQGARTLVATGRYRRLGQGSAAGGPVWVAAARTGAQRFEVVARWSSPNSMGTQNDNATITVVGSNVETPVPKSVGAIAASLGAVYDFASTAGFWNVDGANSVARDAEIAHAEVINDSGAVAYFQVYDLATLPIGAQTPVLSYVVPAGAGLVLEEVPYRVQRRLVLAMSTSPDAFVSAGAGFAQVIVR